MQDNSLSNPGPQGWGEEFQDEQSKVKAELNERDALAESHPLMMQRRAYREPNQELLKKVRDAMLADGIIEGFSCRHVETLVFDGFVDWLAQRVGSCVASGNMRIAARRCLIEVLLLNDPEELFGTKYVGVNNVAPFAPYSYRAGRKIAGINRGDGSYCAAHVRGQKEWGILPCSAPGLVSDAFPEPQSTNLYRKWGNSDSLLEQFARVGRKYRLEESEPIKSAADSKEVLGQQMKPHMVCSMWAFRPDYVHPTWRLANGDPVVIYKRNRSDRWAHNMSVDAQVVIESDEEFTIIDNSWGPNAHKNGSWFAIPTELYDDWCRDSQQMSIGEIDMRDNPSPVTE